MTQAEAAEQGLDNSDRTSKQPKTTPYGRKNPKVKYLSDSSSLERWREVWEFMCNTKLKECGVDARIDRRSLIDQGRENEIPTVHLGHEANLMKLRAERLKREGKNQNQIRKPNKEILSDIIREHNNDVQIELELYRIIEEKLLETKNKLNDIKDKKSALAKEKNALDVELAKLQKLADAEVSEDQRAKESLEMIETINKNALAVIDALENELASCSMFETGKRKRLQQKISLEKQKIADRETYKTSSLSKETAETSMQERFVTIQKKSDAIQEKINNLDAEYQSTLDSVPDDLKEKLATTKTIKTKELMHQK